MRNDFNLKIMVHNPKVVEIEFNTSIDTYYVEKALSTIMRKDPRIRDVFAKALMHSMTPGNNDCTVIYDSTSN